jgi:pyrimidine-specific ribonucleoside hydrolase
MNNKINVLLDMETGDPDDVITLCFLASNPNINLLAVTVMPGTNEQIGLVKLILKEAGLNIPVGSYRIGYPKKCVSNFYYKWLGDFQPQNPDDLGYVIINGIIKSYPDVTILTTAPLKNFKNLDPEAVVKSWVAQGGFAGDDVVPPEYRLKKFDGKITCQTYNFNGDWKTAIRLLKNKNIQRKLIVSKNVCHGIIYDNHIHEKLRRVKDNSFGLNLMFKGMDIYLRESKSVKKLHDPLAACVVIDESICTFAEVELYRTNQGEWGSVLQPGTDTFISISADKRKMMNIFMQ